MSLAMCLSQLQCLDESLQWLELPIVRNHRCLVSLKTVSLHPLCPLLQLLRSTCILFFCYTLETILVLAAGQHNSKKIEKKMFTLAPNNLLHLGHRTVCAFRQLRCQVGLCYDFSVLWRAAVRPYLAYGGLEASQVRRTLCCLCDSALSKGPHSAT